MQNKRTLSFLLFTFLVAFTSCNDKPEVEPGTGRNLSVYPNPTDGSAVVTVSFPENNPFTLEVYDTKGKIMLKEEGSFPVQRQLELFDKPIGKYQVSLKSGDKVLTQTLLKIE